MKRKQTKFEKNDIVNVKIEDMGHDGAGIGKDDSYPVFIKDAIIGDVVTARIMKAKSNYAYAKLGKVVTPSSFRVIPECEFHRQCGGCQLQALNYDKQLEYKQNKVKNNLIRIGGFSPELIDTVMEPIIGMELPFRYRNKAQYPVGNDKTGKLITGFYASRTHDIIANTDCLLGDRRNKMILETVLAFMEANEIAAYDEKSGTGLVRHILIRNGYYTDEIMVCLIINMKEIDNKNMLLSRQQELINDLIKIPGLTNISVNLNSERTNVIMGKKTYVLWGKEAINDKLSVRDSVNDFVDKGLSFTFRISATSFYQINPVQTEKLYSIALEYAGLTGIEVVWDLYCGIGSISFFMATMAKKVFGIENNPEAIHDARENARINDIENVEFFIGKVEDVLPEKFLHEAIKADVIVVDPPRKGCNQECLETMIKMNPQRIVYVSCDSATLARDLQVLSENGYVIRRVRPVDQFGQTIHVEIVCLMEKK